LLNTVVEVFELRNLATHFPFRGALILRAEIIPLEPAPGNAGEGRK